MKHLVKNILLPICFFATAASVHADNKIQYNFIEFRYADAEINDADADGFSFGGSYRLNERYYLRTDYQDIDFDNVSADAQILEIGVGYIHPYKDLDIIGEINFVDIDGNNINSDNGALLTAGFRTKLTPEIEARGSINHITAGDNDTYAQLGANYLLTGALSLDGTLRLGGDVDELTVGLRYFY